MEATTTRCDSSNKYEVVINNHNQLFTSQSGDASKWLPTMIITQWSEQGHRMSCLCELTGNPNLEELKTLGRPANKPFFTRKTGNLVHLATSRLAVQKLECAFSWVDVVFHGVHPCSMVHVPSLFVYGLMFCWFEADCLWLISYP